MCGGRKDIGNKSLYLPLNFAVNLEKKKKIALKNVLLQKKKKLEKMIMSYRYTCHMSVGIMVPNKDFFSLWIPLVVATRGILSTPKLNCYWRTGFKSHLFAVVSVPQND